MIIATRVWGCEWLYLYSQSHRQVCTKTIIRIWTTPLVMAHVEQYSILVLWCNTCMYKHMHVHYSFNHLLCMYTIHCLVNTFKSCKAGWKSRGGWGKNDATVRHLNSLSVTPRLRTHRSRQVCHGLVHHTGCSNFSMNTKSITVLSLHTVYNTMIIPRSTQNLIFYSNHHYKEEEWRRQRSHLWRNTLLDRQRN